jgi:hypothetical protein
MSGQIGGDGAGGSRVGGFGRCPGLVREVVPLRRASCSSTQTRCRLIVDIDSPPVAQLLDDLQATPILRDETYCVDLTTN